MAAKPKIAKRENTCQAKLVSTQLQKLSVITLLAPEDSGKGTLELAIKTTRVPKEKEQNTVVIRLDLKGKGLTGGKNSNQEDKTAFTVDATIDGNFSLPHKPTAVELEGCDPYLANYLMPILSDMVETLLSKCGYIGIALPRSFEMKSEPAAAVVTKQK